MKVNHRKWYLGSSGLSIVEIIVAVAFSVVALAALVTLGVLTARTADAARSRSQAVELAKEGLEAVRSIRDNTTEFVSDNYAICHTGGTLSCTCDEWRWTNVASCPWDDGTTFDLDTGDSGYWKLVYVNEGTSGNYHTAYQMASPNEMYFRKVSIVEGPTGDGSDKEIEVIVSWMLRDQQLSVSEKTLLTDWR
jgi:hypothetical protein